MDSKPWTDVLIDSKEFTVYKDGYTVTEGHILFVPKDENWQGLTKCFEAAYKWGYDWIERGYCDAFNIGQNVGEAAGAALLEGQLALVAGEELGGADSQGFCFVLSDLVEHFFFAAPPCGGRGSRSYHVSGRCVFNGRGVG